MLINLLILSRPLNIFIASLTTAIAASLSPLFNFQSSVFWAMLSVAFITAAANIINDIFDIGIDKINKPQRILPSGKVSIKTAWISYILFNICGLCFAGIVNRILTLMALGSIILLFFYSFYFKRTILWGNILVSFMAGVTFIYSTIAIDDTYSGLIPAVFAFLFHLGREIIKDMEDIEGDLAQKVITFPGRFGKTKSFILIDFIFLFLSGFLFIPLVLNNYNVYYIYIVVFAVIPVLFFTMITIWFKNDPENLAGLSMLLKIDMIAGLTAIFCGVNLTV